MATSISNPQSFHAEARFQRVCAACGSWGEFEAHHVISKQRLKQMGLIACLYDTRNALRLCRKCHTRFEQKMLVVTTSMLTRQNLCFMWEMLKEAARNYLERHYTGVNRYFTLHEEERCPLCQRRPRR